MLLHSIICANILLLTRSTSSGSGGDRVLARSQELVDTATKMMAAGEFYDGKP